MEERARALKFREVGIVCCFGLDKLCDLGSLSFIFLSCQTGISLLNKYLYLLCARHSVGAGDTAKSKTRQDFCSYSTKNCILDKVARIGLSEE